MKWLISFYRSDLGHPAITLDWHANPMTEKRDGSLQPLSRSNLCSNISERLLDSLGCLTLEKVWRSRTNVSAPPLLMASIFLWASKKPGFWQPGLHQWRHFGRLALLVILWTIPLAQHVLWSLVGTISRELGVPPDPMATQS